MTQAQEKRMNELQKILREASDAYYNDEEIMTNREYDELYDELVALEEETGVIYSDSMTQIAGAEAVDELPKIKHEYPSLSLAKTKVPSDLVKQMIKNPKCNQSVMMWKADGSTVVATYDNGRLTRLVTRGNGEVGSEITHNAPYIKGLPMAIPCKDHIVVRGEAIMTYTEFERINNELPVGVEKYKNPRNLANSTISLLDPNEMKEREIQFLGFNFVARIDESSGMDIRYDDFANRMKELETFGFQTVEWELVDNSNIESTVTKWTNKVEMIDFPVDGLVIASNDASYAEKQPGTGHNPNNLVGFAFKWEDELVQTHLRDIEWSVGRTGLITPVAIFDPVEICGTTVSRASMHNLSEMGRILDTPYIGQEISVYKANMIIPQVDHGVPMDVVPMDVTTIDHPLSCPCCKTDVTVKESKGGVKTLVCENDDCPSKMIGKLEHFCKRDCLNIVGMSGETIEKLVNAGFVKRYSDFFHLDEHPGIAQMDGFGKRSFEKMVFASEKARTTDFVSFIHSLGIPNVGKGQAKLLKNYIEAHMEELCPTYDENKPVDYYSILTDMFDKNFDFRKIDGFGDVIQKSLYEFRDKYVGTPNRIPKSFDVQAVYDELGFTDVCKKKDKNSAILEGKTFVITGDVHVFKNRNEISEKIESLGGKVSGSVSAKTSYLINNDVTSTSGKNKKAQDLNIPIISEEDFLAMIEPEKTEDMER